MRRKKIEVEIRTYALKTLENDGFLHIFLGSSVTGSKANSLLPSTEEYAQPQLLGTMNLKCYRSKLLNITNLKGENRQMVMLNKSISATKKYF